MNNQAEVGKDRQARERATPSRSTGYAQDVDADGLLRFARKQACVVRMEQGLGEFIVKDSPLVSLAYEE